MTNATLQWDDVNGQPQHAAWHSEAGRPAPARMQVADDRLAADAAYHLICEGSTLLWQGDFFNARHLMEALKRRLDKPKLRGKAQKNAKPAHPPAPAATPALAFHQQRQVQARRAHILGSILIPLNGDYRIPLRRAPDVQAACTQAWGPADGTARVIALRELQGIVSAYEWRKNGVQIPALQTLGGYDRIHPHYGVFSPVRGEYVDLVAQAPLPATATQTAAVAWDIGTGTGVLAAVLARRGVPQVIATDHAARALACAQDNVQRLGVAAQVQLCNVDLFPPGHADLIVCNPPWLPVRATTSLEQAVYDPDSRMLRGFLAGLAAHLRPGGEGWLILSDLAEHLGLRSRADLLAWTEAAGLRVVGRLDIRPHHRKAQNASDPLHSARAAEVTSLWRLAV
ncbi:MAG TPA: class I SAM-dependent methyltransferase [Comamonas denitrificans]|nr:class I SAM-dependent methyltransferase [Comamonas denitrificans]HRM67402.1 class I SAM-dependent methyltransferase [Comamonas denitrificans]